METEFIYWRHKTPAGIRVEEVCGGENRDGELWRKMAMQIYCENGKESYRQIGHFSNGAPFIDGEESRISLSHTKHFLAVATLPPTPESDLRGFSRRTAMGIDAEREDRAQVLKVRERFLFDTELPLLPADSVERNILAWTAKEALFKAALGLAHDIREDLGITKLPEFGTVPGDILGGGFGKGFVRIKSVDADGNETCEQFPMELYSWKSEGCIVTLAYSSACAKFTKKG